MRLLTGSAKTLLLKIVNFLIIHRLTTLSNNSSASQPWDQRW
jgi:hypothetical protein